MYGNVNKLGFRSAIIKVVIGAKNFEIYGSNVVEYLSHAVSHYHDYSYNKYSILNTLLLS